MERPPVQRVAVDQVWTPVQHTALWLGAWVTGQVSYDHLLDALDAAINSLPNEFICD